MRKILLPLLLMACSGCSVFMAASSPGEPDLSVLKPGVSRAAVEQELGRPITFSRRRGGDAAVYQYVGADQVSYERAAAYAVADIITLGVAEIVTAPVEALQNDKHVVTVIYDSDGFVRKAYHSVEQAPLDRPEKMLGIEKEPESMKASFKPQQ